MLTVLIQFATLVINRKERKGFSMRLFAKNAKIKQVTPYKIIPHKSALKALRSLRFFFCVLCG